MTQILDGKKLAAEIEARVTAETKTLKETKGIVPGLCTVLVGSDPASVVYVKRKQEAAQRCGFHFELKSYPENFAPEKVADYIIEKNADPKIHGILVQFPLPDTFDEIELAKKIHPYKDVDCLHPKNIGLLLLGKPLFEPPIVRAVLELLTLAHVDVSGKGVVIVGAGNIAGKPIALALKNRSATVTLCDSKTSSLEKYTREADVVITAVGVPKLITKDMVKKGSVVIDAGTMVSEKIKTDPPRDKEKRVLGDVDFENVKDVAGAISPVPGGVGPMTVAMLLQNTLDAAKRSSLMS